MENRNFTVGSLFAGVGGICQAFKNAGCSILWANEIDPDCRTTYKSNHPEVPFTEKNDVSDLNKCNVNPVDVLTAGFPCQPFSHAGRALGFEDERGHLFFEITRLLVDLRPTAYFLENVKSLVTHNKGETFQTVRKELYKKGYSFIPFVLKTSEYSDIPQGRERLYIVGFRDEKRFSYDYPIEENSGFQNGSSWAPLSSGFEIPPKLDSAPRSVRSFLEPATVIAHDYYDNPKNEIHRRVQDAVKDPEIVYQYRRWFVRENKSNVCPTLTANMGLGGHNVPIVLNGKYPRRLTPKECFNLQGFPSGFKLPSEVSRTSLYRQCGNSVVVPVVERIAREIVRVLNENRGR